MSKIIKIYPSKPETKSISKKKYPAGPKNYPLNEETYKPYIYTKDEIKTLLDGFILIKNKDLFNEELLENARLYFTHVRFYDTKFKKGGMLINRKFYDGAVIITIKSGNFVWKVNLNNVKYLWITDPDIVEEKYLNKQKEKKEKKIIQENKKNEKSSPDSDELNKCQKMLKLLDLYNKGKLSLKKK
jgi:hypothetical protein